MTVEVVGDAKAWSEEEIRELAVDGFDGVLVPGIVRRQEQGAEGLCVGFSSPSAKTACVCACRRASPARR